MNQHSLTLFFLPFSGGNCYSYKAVESHLPTRIKPVALELPGHGRRLKEPLLMNIHDIVDDIFRQIEPSLSSPYAVFGHSMGAIAGYMLAERLLKERLPAPRHLFVSGHASPSAEDKDEPIHLLPDAQFIEKVMEYGGIPQAVAAEKDLMDLFVPILKADFQALDDFTYQAGELLTVPMTVMIGQDEDIADEDAAAWQDVTSEPVTVKTFPGGHFFLLKHWPEIGRLISHTLGFE